MQTEITNPLSETQRELREKIDKIPEAPGEPREDNGKLPDPQSALMEIIKKQNRLIRFQSAVQSAILLLLIGVAAIAVIFFIRVQTTIDTVDATLDTVDTKIDDLDIESLNNSIVALKEASAKIESLDASTINDSITSLSEAAKTFSKIDTEQINELTESLNNSAAAIEEVTDNFSEIFS